MGTRSETTAEILVHITAPSRASDDARYRALASAYLAFEPAHTVELPKATTDSSQDSLDAFISPQASFRSVWDNANSPSLAIGKRHSESRPNLQSHPHPQEASQHGNETQASWIAPPSEVPDSMPDNDISVAAFCTPTRVLNYYLQSTDPPSSSPAGSSDQVPEHDRNAFIGTIPQEAYDTVVLTREPSTRSNRSAKKRPRCADQTPERAESSWGGVVPGDRKVRTPSSPIQHSNGGLAGVLPGSGFSPERSQAIQLSQEVIDGTTIIPSTQLLERAASEPLSSKRLKRGPAKQVAQALGRSISDLLPEGSKQGTDLQQVSLEDDEEDPVLENPDWSHATQIISAEPFVGNHSLGPAPPVNLERLAEDMEIKRRYQPTYQAREMCLYERGYWLVKLDGWDHHEKVAFWGFLGNWIRRDGNAGWGTRACRDESWDWIRLYGWEHIAGELYILLYVASYRLLKCMEMKFYDGAGNVLIIVGARSDRRRLG
ncbi:hypothetical protein VM1G_01673 [Cytospora mali]|uniref:Uncharacterized protein n=1 Tax=Cytospora mali TaxID=578113 RepID=A0A194VSB6_CYTMA|nr:hypothetical protein VM1G_01673 [Valsa mali]